MDLCFGHAAKGKYHHHNYPNCFAQKLNDTGSSHSPIYGFTIDSFPIYGPWQSKNTLAKSCWKLRDYSSNSKTGCSNNKRSCILKNIYDYNDGIINVTNSGPSFDDNIITQSGNNIIAKNGVYFQDYYYDITCTNDNNLNEFNGHDHDDLGFHYHFTIDKDTYLPTFPYAVGPKFFGSIPESSHCCPSFLDAVAMGLGEHHLNTLPPPPPPPPCLQPPCPNPIPPCQEPPCPNPQPQQGCNSKSIGSEYTYGIQDGQCLFR